MTFGWPQTFSLTTADVTFELSVDKGRSEAASPGYTPTHTIDMAQWAIGYFGQMSPTLHHDNTPPPPTVRKCEFTVRCSHPSDSPLNPAASKHFTPCCVFSFTRIKYSKLSIKKHTKHSCMNPHVPLNTTLTGTKPRLWYLHRHHPASSSTVFLQMSYVKCLHPGDNEGYRVSWQDLAAPKLRTDSLRMLVCVCVCTCVCVHLLIGGRYTEQ